MNKKINCFIFTLNAHACCQKLCIPTYQKLRIVAYRLHLEHDWHLNDQEDGVEAVIRHLEYAIEFAFANDRLYQIYGSDVIKWIYSDSLLIKKVLKLVAQRCHLMEKIKELNDKPKD